MADLFLAVDGNSLAHRAYHAMPPLWRHRGEANQAVYGFTAMLVKALAQLRPTYGAVAFDTPEPTFRHLAYADYKGQRGEAPDDLYAQFDRIRRVAEALGLACVEQAGYEADDVLATLATQAAERDLEVVVLTGDGDALQLVGGPIRVLMPVKGMSEAVMYDQEGVRARCGVEPAKVPDLKALMGDSSDNIPGVPGIGPKTAAALVERFGTIDALLAGLDELPPAQRETLEAKVEQVRAARALTTLRRDAPLHFDPSCCRVAGYDRDASASVLRSVGIGRLEGRLPDYDAPPAPPTRPKRRKAAPEGQLSLFG